MWSALSCGEAFPGRRSSASASPVPYSPWSTNAHIGANPNVFLKVGSAPSLSECARHQRGVDIDDHLAAITAARTPGQRPAPCPHRCARPGTGSPDRGQRGIDVRGQSSDQPGHRRIRGDRAEHLRLRTDRGHISQAVAAERDRGRDIEQHLARIMNRTIRAPRPQHPRQRRMQTRQPDGLPQQQPTRRRHQRLADRIENKTRYRVTLHLRSAFPLGDLRRRNPKNPLQDRHFRVSHAVINPAPTKSRG